jgi:pantoate--beta-alanine ligase
MDIIREPQALQKASLHWRAQGLATGLVPTMGYFHAGHLSLMDFARQRADRVVVSLFVNPTQFGPNEDLGRYPRDFERDAALAREHGVDLLFAPEPGAMYAPDHATWVEVPDLARGLCGATRPTHFKGVTTVVAKLFHLAQPTFAVFGEKDWQQLAIIRRMVRDLHFPLEVVGRPIVREADGLALSSRNVFLTDEERRAAPGIHQGLLRAAEQVGQGQRRSAKILADLEAFYAERVPMARLDYARLVDPESLEPMEEVRGAALLAVALFMSKARLIDNTLLAG